jgi:hypothetical protein
VIVVPDGDVDGNGVTDIGDALKALRITVGLDLPSATELLHGDVAPLVIGGAPDNVINVADALLIMNKVVGLTSF